MDENDKMSSSSSMEAEEFRMEDIVGVERRITDDDGVMKKILVKGEGYDTPQKGDEVTVHYVGTLLDGSKFDSSRDRNDPFKFTLGEGRVIKGWDEGVATMKKGEKSLLTCKPEYAYGKSGSPPKIPADSTLQFEVELLSWKSVNDISHHGNGSLIKTITSEGTGWTRPKANDEARVSYKAYITGQEKPFAETPEEGIEFTVKEGHLCAAIASTVKTMKKGEKATITAGPEYGCKGEFAREDVPADSNLTIELCLNSWNAVTDVTNDGAVTMKVVNDVEGEYKRPNEGGTVTVRYVGTLPDGTKFVERLEGDEHVFTIDEEDVVEGLDLAIQKMKKGEKAIVSIQPFYAFKDTEAAQPLATVPPNTAVIYEVELVSFENLKESWELSTEEKLAAVEERKNAGNVLFKAGKNLRALKRYERAVGLVEHDSSFTDEQKAKARTLKKSCWLNQAAAQLRLHRYKDACASCTKVLEQDHNNVKALFRRAEAYLATEDFLEAQADLKRALDVEPDNREVAAKLKRAKQLEARYNKSQAKLFGNMFERMAKLEEKEGGRKAEAEAPGVAPGVEALEAMEDGQPSTNGTKEEEPADEAEPMEDAN